MEDLPIKAIVIGVSVFITMTVVSALMIYFNTAKGVATSIGNRADIASNYENIMNGDQTEGMFTGVEVRSLIIKYAKNFNVMIDIASISGEESEYNNVNNTWIDRAGVISEAKLDLINPVWNCNVKKVKSGENIRFEIDLDVEK